MAHLSDFVAGLLRRTGKAIFTADDKFARNQGWPVETARFGMSWSYRHPSFDQLAWCLECSDRGASQGGRLLPVSRDRADHARRPSPGLALKGMEGYL
jgi:hypothetical protein